jgi:phospholipid-binding lipoprotein MlaA
MPNLAFLTVSQPLLSAALAVPGLPPSPPADPYVATLAWSLQDTQPSGPPDESETPPDDSGSDDSGEILVEGEYGPPAGDPVEKFNATSYRITNAVDQAVIEPVAYAYRDGLPEPIRDGLGNVVKNLGEPSNALNFLLQGKVGKAFGALGRLAINSTIGLGGLFDVAGKGAGIPYRRNGFANTMGFYGVGPGPYLYLPVTGATSVRDLVGSTLDQALLPFAVGKPFNRPAYAATYFVVNGLDQRVEFDQEIAAIRSTDDPYLLRRQTYLAQRRRDIAALKGEPISEEDAEWLAELEALKQAPASSPAPAGSAPPVDPPAPGDAAPVEAPANPEVISITQPR